GAVVGTPAFMAPEQAMGKPVDARCDQFSLGAMLYRMATGEMAFKGEHTLAILSALAMTNPPPPHTLRPQGSEELSDVIMKLLEKEPENRFASAQEAADVLRSLQPVASTQVMAKPKTMAVTKAKTPKGVEPTMAGAGGAKTRWPLW